MLLALAITANASTGAKEQHIKQHFVLQIRNGYLMTIKN